MDATLVLDNCNFSGVKRHESETCCVSFVFLCFFFTYCSWRTSKETACLFGEILHLSDLARHLCGYFDLPLVNSLLASSSEIRSCLIQIILQLRDTTLACYPCETMRQWTAYDQSRGLINIRFNIRWDGWIVRNLPLLQHMLHTEIIWPPNKKVQFEPFQYIAHHYLQDDFGTESSSSSDDAANGFWVSYDASRRFALMFHGHIVSTPRPRRDRGNYWIWTYENGYCMVHGKVSKQLDLQYNDKIRSSRPQELLTRLTLDRRFFGQLSILCVTESHIQYLESQGSKFKKNDQGMVCFLWNQVHSATIGKQAGFLSTRNL